MTPEEDTHPLKSNPVWEFLKPDVGFSSSFVLRTLEGEEVKKHISNYGNCREGIIANIRTGFAQGGFTSFVPREGASVWEGALRPTGQLVLPHPLSSGPGETVIKVHNLRKNGSKQQFLQMADALVGIPCVLLHPGRAAGDWWQTPEDKQTGDWLAWYGSDNFFLRHPALLSIVLGLLRQTFILWAHGFGDEILKSFERKEVEAAISTPDWQAAFGLADRLRTWISVPAAPKGDLGHFPFPWYPRKAKQVSYWQRFVRLQRAVRRHGYDEVLGEDFHASWALLNRNPYGYHTGAFNFWGGLGDNKVTDAHKRVMSLGKPLTRKKDASA